jgi:hypothetical protein
MKVRLTIEYDTGEVDPQTLDEVRQAWEDGNITYQDAAYLARTTEDYSIRFEEITQ